MRLLVILFCSLSLVPPADACQFKINAVQIQEGQRNIQTVRRELSKLARKSNRILVGSVEDWKDASARFRDVVELKGRTPEQFEVQWKELLVRKHRAEREDVTEIRCETTEALEGQVPDTPSNFDVAKVSYLVYARGNELLRAVPLDRAAHQEIEWLQQAGRINLRW